MLWDLAPDTRAEVGWFWLAHDRHGALTLFRLAGTLPDDGAFESEYLYLYTVARDHVAHLEMLELDAVDAAPARFEELGAGGHHEMRGYDTLISRGRGGFPVRRPERFANVPRRMLGLLGRHVAETPHRPVTGWHAEPESLFAAALVELWLWDESWSRRSGLDGRGAPHEHQWKSRRYRCDHRSEGAVFEPAHRGASGGLSTVVGAFRDAILPRADARTRSGRATSLAATEAPASQ